MNRWADHLIVLPEDTANHNLATGFQLELDWACQGRYQVMPAPGGWVKTFEALRNKYLDHLRKYPTGHLLVLIDFDGDANRRSDPNAMIPGDVSDRVYVLGTLHEPEDLKKSTKAAFEDIGRSLAQACRSGSPDLWSHAHLAHNDSEVSRLRNSVRPFLFP